MQISKIQNHPIKSTNFKHYSITPQAKALVTTPEKLQITQRAERLFKNSKHVDFEIGNNFTPTIKIKETGEKLVGDLKALFLEHTNGIRIADNKSFIDIVLPRGYKAKHVENKINNSFNDSVAKASYIGELIKITAEDHSGRFLL